MKLSAALTDRDVQIAAAALRVWQGCPAAGAWLTPADWQRAEVILEGDTGEKKKRREEKRVDLCE